MKTVFYILFLFINFIGQAQCKTEIITIILEEHIKNELPEWDIDKDDIIICVNISNIDKENWAINIDAFPLNTFPNVEDVKKINDVRVKFDYNNTSKKLKKKINKRYKNIEEIREVEIQEFYSLTHYRGVSVFQLNKHNEFYIISTSDDEYYYQKFNERKLKFSKDLKFSKEIGRAHV